MSRQHINSQQNITVFMLALLAHAAANTPIASNEMSLIKLKEGMLICLSKENAGYIVKPIPGIDPSEIASTLLEYQRAMTVGGIPSEPCYQLSSKCLDPLTKIQVAATGSNTAPAFTPVEKMPFAICQKLFYAAQKKQREEKNQQQNHRELRR